MSATVLETTRVKLVLSKLSIANQDIASNRIILIKYLLHCYDTGSKVPASTIYIQASTKADIHKYTSK